MELEENQGFYYSSHLDILTFVGINENTNDIFVVILYNLRNHTCKLNKIDTIKINGDYCQESLRDIECLKCIWKFSNNKSDIIFYMMDMNKSKIVIWDCEMCKIKFKYTKFFNFTFLRVRKDVSNDNLLTSPGPSSPRKAIYDWEIPEIWFTYDYESLIVNNPLNNSFIALNEDTEQTTVDSIIDGNMKGNIKRHDPVFIGHYILFLGDSKKSTNVNNLQNEIHKVI